MFRRVQAVAFLVLVILSVSVGQNKSNNDEKIKGFRKEFLVQMVDIEKKLLDLADAMPADKYSWRPMEGVRSVSEVYIHIAGANYLFPSMVGFKRPDDLVKDAEKNVTDKPKVIEYLKKSFDFIRDAVKKTSDDDLDKAAKLFGDETTVRGVFFEAGLHMHEHFGQSIAYARMNKVVPPWTAAEQAQNPPPKK
jgi:uncharacterized damage-inducible protein DinB